MYTEEITGDVDNIKAYNGIIYVKVSLQNGYKWINFSETSCHTDYLIEHGVIPSVKPKTKKRK